MKLLVVNDVFKPSLYGLMNDPGSFLGIVGLGQVDVVRILDALTGQQRLGRLHQPLHLFFGEKLLENNDIGRSGSYFKLERC